jgi:hypothetical protein
MSEDWSSWRSVQRSSTCTPEELEQLPRCAFRRLTTAGRLEPLLATALSRPRSAVRHVAIAAAGAVIVVGACGLGAGLADVIASDDAGRLPLLVGSSLAQVPAVWVLLGLAVALFGLVPRAAPASWRLLGACFLLAYLGPLLSLPDWVMDLSPYSHVPLLPAADLTVTPVDRADGDRRGTGGGGCGRLQPPRRADLSRSGPAGGEADTVTSERLFQLASALAPAGVGLALCVATAEARMDDAWSDGVLLVAAAVPAILLLVLGLAATRDHDDAPAAGTILLVAGLALAGLAINWLGQVLAGDGATSGGGTLTGMLALFGALAAFCAHITRSSACLLITALATVGLLLEGVNWIFGTSDVDAFRAVLAVAFVVLFGAGLAVGGRHGTILVGAAGVTVLVLSYATGYFLPFFPPGDGLGWGWELVTLVQGLALLAYAAVRLEPGPGYLAFFALVVFALTTAVGGGVVGDPSPGQVPDSLLGWPLALGIGTVIATVWALGEVRRGA